MNIEIIIIIIFVNNLRTMFEIIKKDPCKKAVCMYYEIPCTNKTIFVARILRCEAIGYVSVIRK